MSGPEREPETLRGCLGEALVEFFGGLAVCLGGTALIALVAVGWQESRVATGVAVASSVGFLIVGLAVRGATRGRVARAVSAVAVVTTGLLIYFVVNCGVVRCF